MRSQVAWGRRAVIITLGLIGARVGVSSANTLNVSGGADARYVNTQGRSHRGVLEGLFLNVRQVFSDAQGDRWIAVGQLDLDDNVDKIRPYQTYLQYKGPLGRWNIRAGHYILPFGLLSSHDTERLLLTTLEPFSVGIKLDTGLEIFGFQGPLDYAISVSQGVGRRHLTDVDDDKLVVGRLEWDHETLTLGLSGLIGTVLQAEEAELNSGRLYEKRLAVDMTTKTLGPLIVRMEGILGENGGPRGQTVGGGLLLADYALSSKLELNFKAGHWQERGGRNFLGAGLTYQVVKGLFLRMADTYQLGREERNVAAAQVYAEFSRSF